MLEMEEVKPLKERIPEFLEKLQDYDKFYLHNEEMLDIYEGNLLPYVEELMSKTLDNRYFSMIKHRILPINFIQKVTDKLAKSYAEEPMRKCEDQEFVDYYTSKLDLDSRMGLAEEYSYLNRGYALKPKLTNKGKIKMDVLPYDSFFVIADDHSDKLCPTVFIEFMGITERMRTVKGKEEFIEMDWYIAYSDTEILAFTEDGEWMSKVTENISHRNPIGQIPFVYGNRSVSNIVPKQDTDFLALAKLLPLMLSDWNGALFFQCFTLIYGIDIEFADAKMSPNAIWELKSRDRSDKPASVGTLTPTVDTEKALSFFKNVLAMWLDSKGIDAGSIMQLDSQEIASGLSKAMDELDTTEARKKSIKKLAKEEKELFILLAKLNNYWMTLPEARDLALVSVNVEVVEDSMEVEFKEPTPNLDYTTEINNSVTMLREGLSYREKEIRRLHPYATEDEINLMFYEYGISRVEVGDKLVTEGVDPEKEEDTQEDQGNVPGTEDDQEEGMEMAENEAQNLNNEEEQNN